MSKKLRIFSLIMAVVLACGMLAGCGCEKKEQGVEVKPDDPMWHGNGMEAMPSYDEEGNLLEDLLPGDPRQEYSLQCRFEGKMDENSFEVTELDFNSETGEYIDGPLLQMRVGNDSVREDLKNLEIGDNTVVFCSYNEDSQLVAKRFIIFD